MESDQLALSRSSETEAPMPIRDPYIGRYADKYLVVDGLRLHYTTWGERDRPCVMLVHGLQSMLHTWDPIADALCEDYYIVNLDLRGHGDSDWTRQGYAVQRLVSDIHGFAQQLELPPFDMVGHSLGARVGIAYAGTFTDDLRHLVLSDAGPEVSRDAGIRVRARLARSSDVKGFRNEAEALAFFEDVYPEWRPIFHQLHVKHQLRLNWADKLVFKADPDVFWLTGSAGLREVPFLWEAASAITCPTLIMRGTDSYFLSAETARQMLATILGSQLAEFATGHHIPREAPEEFVRVLRGFLAS